MPVHAIRHRVGRLYDSRPVPALGKGSVLAAAGRVVARRFSCRDASGCRSELILGGSSNIAPGIWPTLNGTVKTGGTWPVRLKKSEGGVGPFTGCTVFNRRGETSPTDHGQTGFN